MMTMKKREVRRPELEVWLSGKSPCLACVKPWLRSSALGGRGRRKRGRQRQVIMGTG